MDIITYCNDNDNDNVVDEILVMLVLGPDRQSAAQVRHACAAQHPFCPSAALGGDFMGKSSTWGLNQPSMVVEWNRPSISISIIANFPSSHFLPEARFKFSLKAAMFHDSAQADDFQRDLMSQRVLSLGAEICQLLLEELRTIPDVLRR
jgi:hypothetical protein